MVAFDNILAQNLWGNSVEDYLISIAIFAGLLLVLRLFKHVVIKRMQAVAKKTATEIDDAVIDVLEQLGWPFYVVLSLFISLQFLTLSQTMWTIITFLLIAVMTFYASRIITSIILFSSKKVSPNAPKSPIVHLMIVGVNIILWVVIIILLLDNFGVDVAALLAGIGIAGIAIAFALQSILSDIFASVSIHFDKPFEVGDFIIIGNDLGTVEKIGIKTTRIKTLQGQELVVSNQELTSTRINNYKRMEQRRIVFSFGVEYDTPVSKLKRVPDMVKKIIAENPTSSVDRVHFSKFGDYALEFEAVYFVATSDYNKYMDIQQEINLGIKKAFEKEKIEMAYPTQTVYVKKQGGKK
jgi:small-conductance mechanosensitive channel